MAIMIPVLKDVLRCRRVRTRARRRSPSLAGCAGCGGASDGATPSRRSSPPSIRSPGPRERVGGDRRRRREPHARRASSRTTSSSSPRDVERVRDADLVLYLGGGFQPALEDAVARTRRRRPARSTLLAARTRVATRTSGSTRCASRRSSRTIGAALGQPEPADALAARARRARRGVPRGGLANCERREHRDEPRRVRRTSPTRYGLDAALARRSRRPRPSRARASSRRLIDEVRERTGATTVFAEPLVSTRLAETVAREAGVDDALRSTRSRA